MEALTTMYKNDWMMGADDLGIDEIRAQFAAGKVGMFPAPSSLCVPDHHCSDHTDPPRII